MLPINCVKQTAVSIPVDPYWFFTVLQCQHGLREHRNVPPFSRSSEFIYGDIGRKRQKWRRMWLRRIAPRSGSTLRGMLRMDDGDTTELPFDSCLEIYIFNMFFLINNRHKQKDCECSEQNFYQSVKAIKKMKVTNWKLGIRHPEIIARVCVLPWVWAWVSVCEWFSAMYNYQWRAWLNNPTPCNFLKRHKAQLPEWGFVTWRSKTNKRFSEHRKKILLSKVG